MAKILVLGQQGMLGQELIKQLSKFYEVIGFAKAELDIIDYKKLANKIVAIKPAIIINAVAINAVDKIEETEEFFKLARKVNGEAVGELARLCQQHNILLVHFSSDYVFAGDEKLGYSEKAIINPVNKYGETKALGEKLLQEQTDKYYLIRLSRLFGKKGSSQDAKNSFVDVMLDLVEKKGKHELEIVNEELSSPTYAVDLGQLVVRLLQEQRPFGIYHGANQGACTWYEFAQEIFKIKKLKVVCQPVAGDKFKRPAPRPKFSVLNNTKLLPKQRSWQEALQDYLK